MKLLYELRPFTVCLNQEDKVRWVASSWFFISVFLPKLKAQPDWRCGYPEFSCHLAKASRAQEIRVSPRPTEESLQEPYHAPKTHCPLAQASTTKGISPSFGAQGGEICDLLGPVLWVYCILSGGGVAASLVQM